MKKELNPIFKLAISLVIIRHAIALVLSILNIYYAIEGFLLWKNVIVSIVQSIVMIVLLLYILKIKRWAIYAFGVFQIINVVVMSILKGDPFTSIIIALVMCAILAGLLCLRNNGISGWWLFFASESELASEAENAVSVNETITKTDNKEE